MRPSVRQSLRLLVTYLRRQRGAVLALAALLLASTLLQLLQPQVVRLFVDGLVLPATASGAAAQARTQAAILGGATGLGVLYVVAAVAQQTLAIAATYYAECVGWTATNDLRADLAAHCLRLDLGFHK